jgi:hypothetical protein
MYVQGRMPAAAVAGNARLVFLTQGGVNTQKAQQFLLEAMNAAASAAAAASTAAARDAKPFWYAIVVRDND